MVGFARLLSTPMAPLAGALLLLVLAACDSPRAQADAAGGERAPAAQPPVSPTASPRVLLEGHGLRLASAAGTIVFGGDRDRALAAVEEALGAPPSAQGETAACAGGASRFARWDDALTLWFDDDKFAGWTVDGALTTPDGITVGSPRRHVERLAGFEAKESGVAAEFSAGGYRGRLDGAGPGARVSALWAGTPCARMTG